MNENEEEIIDNFFNMLCKESELKFPELNYEEKIWYIKNLMILRPFGNLDEDMIKAQNEFFNLIKMEDIKLEKLNIKYKNNLSEINENIFLIKSDMIVDFTDSLFADAKDINSFDNQIVINGGMQIIEEINKQLKIDRNIIKYNQPYIINGFNLLQKYIAKLLINNIFFDEKLLEENIVNLFQFIKNEKINLISIKISNKISNINKEIIIKIIQKYNKNKAKILIFA